MLKIRKVVSIVFILILVFSCTKKLDLTPLEKSKSFLVGPLKIRTWKLESYLINSLPQVLTLNQKRYSKTFYYSGQFDDADGSSGQWQLPVVDSLVEKYQNFPSGTPAIQGYKILGISDQNLILQYTINGTTYTTIYKAL